MNVFAIGAIVNGALYLSSVFVAGLLTGHPAAMLCAIAAFGLASLSHLLAYMVANAQKRALIESKSVSATTLAMLGFQGLITIASILIGAIAGLFLI